MRSGHDSRRNSTAQGSHKSQLCHSSQRAISRRSIAGAFLQTPARRADPSASAYPDRRSMSVRLTSGVGVVLSWQAPCGKDDEAFRRRLASMPPLRQAACAHGQRGPTGSPRNIVPQYGHRHRLPQRPHGANGPRNTLGPESIHWTNPRSSTSAGTGGTVADGRYWHA